MERLKISFGTDGWRAVMCEDFTLENVSTVARAIASYLIEEKQASKGVVVGYDTRFFSDRFAQACADIFKSEGISVYLCRKALPTPVVAFSVKAYQTAGAVMITASHNPYQYNGIKFIPHYAGPATTEITKKIEVKIKELLRKKEGSRERLAEIKNIDPTLKYLSHLKKLIDFEAIKKAKLKVVADPLYGAGQNIFFKVLEEAGIKIIPLHDFRDVLFAGGMPDPSKKNLLELSSVVRKEDAHLGLALDGDADRFGVVDEKGKYFSANQVLPLVAEHLINNRGFEGAIVRSVATTHHLDRVADFFGVSLFETPVGFKYIGEIMCREQVVLGGEESAGLSIGGHIPEKDGILACLLITELLAYERKSLSHLLQLSYKRYGRHMSERFDIHCSPGTKEALLKELKQKTPSKIGDMKLERAIVGDGVKLVFDDGSWVLARPSGTEPLVRIYVESFSPQKFKLLKDFSLGLVERLQS